MEGKEENHINSMLSRDCIYLLTILISHFGGEQGKWRKEEEEEEEREERTETEEIHILNQA